MTGLAAILSVRATPIERVTERRGIKLKRHGSELVGPCPRCGGRDRFAINVRKQVFNCRGCRRGGGAIALVQFLDGCSFTEAIETLSGERAERPRVLRPTPPIEHDDTERTARAIAIWKEAHDPRGTPVETYLAHRRLVLPAETFGEAIRFHPACPFKDHRTPAMIALVRDLVTNEPKAIHRTALDTDGRKAWIDGHERLSLGPIGGGAVKLTRDEDIMLCLGVGEGIESTLSMRLAREFGASPVWALLSAGQVATFPVLAGIEALWIAVDHDPAGVEAARSCAARWRAARHEVFLVKPQAEREDLNDLVRAA